MRKAQYLIFAVLILFMISESFASKIDVTEEYDFKFALDYIAQVYNSTSTRVDTILLTTSGGNYTTTDTTYLQITIPIVIKASPDLAEKPMFTHSDPDSGVLEIFRIHNDAVRDGFDRAQHGIDIRIIRYIDKRRAAGHDDSFRRKIIQIADTFHRLDA